MYDRWRGSSSSRGYDTRWTNWRNQYIKRHPLCVDHLALGIVKTAQEIHHVVKVRDCPDLQYDETNVMALCKSCHSTRTKRGE